MPTLVLIRGIAGSGKTTLARRYAAQGYVHHESDHYLESLGGDYQTHAANRATLEEAHRQCEARTLSALCQGKNVVVANTFYRRKYMEPYLRIANATGATVKIVICRGDYGSVHNVPAEVLARQRAGWEE